MSDPITPPARPAAVEVARTVAAAAEEDPDVLELHGGTVGEFGTFGQGGRIAGVRVRAGGDGGIPVVTVHAVVRFGRPLMEIAADVRTRVAAALALAHPSYAGARIDVHVVDVRTDDMQALPAQTAAGGGAA